MVDLLPAYLRYICLPKPPVILTQSHHPMTWDLDDKNEVGTFATLTAIQVKDATVNCLSIGWWLAVILLSSSTTASVTWLHFVFSAPFGKLAQNRVHWEYQCSECSQGSSSAPSCLTGFENCDSRKVIQSPNWSSFTNMECLNLEYLWIYVMIDSSSFILDE